VGYQWTRNVCEMDVKCASNPYVCTYTSGWWTAIKTTSGWRITAKNWGSADVHLRRTRCCRRCSRSPPCPLRGRKYRVSYSGMPNSKQHACGFSGPDPRRLHPWAWPGSYAPQRVGSRRSFPTGGCAASLVFGPRSQHLPPPLFPHHPSEDNRSGTPFNVKAA